MGSYWFVSSRADTYSHFYNETADTPYILEHEDDMYATRAAGSTFLVRYDMDVPPATRTSTGSMHVNIYYRYNASQVSFSPDGLTCSWVTGCQQVPSLWNTDTFPQSDGSVWKTAFSVCISIPSTYFSQQNMPLFQLRFTQKATSGVNEGNLLSRWYDTGTCNTSQSETSDLASYLGSSGSYWQIGNGGIGTGDTGLGDGGSGSSTSGSGTSGESSNGTSGGSSSGRTASGSVAQRSDISIPQAAPQGTTKQPELEASPFYDGKRYAAGSTSGLTSVGNAATNNKSGAKWLYVVLPLVILGAFAVYRYRHNKRRG